MGGGAKNTEEKQVKSVRAGKDCGATLCYANAAVVPINGTIKFPRTVQTDHLRELASARRTKLTPSDQPKLLACDGGRGLMGGAR